MTRREIAILACRVLALWAFSQAVACVPAILAVIIAGFEALFSGGVGWEGELVTAAMTGLPALGEAIAGFALWRYAPKLASRMAPDDPEQVTRPDLDYEAVLSVAFMAVGLWTLIPALRDLASITITILRGDSPFFVYWRETRWQARFWSSILVIGISIWLMIGARGMVRLVLMLRHRDGQPGVLPPGGFEVLQQDAADDSAPEK